MGLIIVKEAPASGGPNAWSKHAISWREVVENIQNVCQPILNLYDWHHDNGADDTKETPASGGSKALSNRIIT